MANPQKENGHIQIATEIWEALTKMRINGEARQVLDYIIRKTYGFNKKEDAISLSQFCNGTGLKKQTVIKGLSKLRLLNLITQKGYAVANKYCFNKDFDTWKPLPKKVTQPKKVTSLTQKGYNRNPKRDIQYTVTKDTLTKDISEASPRNEINLLINLFEPINPTSYNLYKNKTQRQAIENLVKRFGFEKVQNMISALPDIINKPYAPVITTPVQLEANLGKLVAFVNKGKTNNRERKIWT